MCYLRVRIFDKGPKAKTLHTHRPLGKDYAWGVRLIKITEVRVWYTDPFILLLFKILWVLVHKKERKSSIATSWIIALLTTHKILNKRGIKGSVYQTWSSVIFVGPGLLGLIGRSLCVYDVFEGTPNPTADQSNLSWDNDIFWKTSESCTHRHIIG